VKKTRALSMPTSRKRLSGPMGVRSPLFYAAYIVYPTKITSTVMINDSAGIAFVGPSGVQGSDQKPRRIGGSFQWRTQ
jgi:hypothetical protein